MEPADAIGGSRCPRATARAQSWSCSSSDRASACGSLLGVSHPFHPNVDVLSQQRSNLTAICFGKLLSAQIRRPDCDRIIHYELLACVVAGGRHSEREGKHERQQAERRSHHGIDRGLSLVLGFSRTVDTCTKADFDRQQNDCHRDDENQPERNGIEQGICIGCVPGASCMHAHPSTARCRHCLSRLRTVGARAHSHS